MAASVATKPSMVAIFGLNHAGALAMPVRVTVLPPSSTWREAALGRMSVVMIAFGGVGPAAGAALRQGADDFSNGSGSRITPVENGSTCSAWQPSCSATA